MVCTAVARSSWQPRARKREVESGNPRALDQSRSQQNDLRASMSIGRWPGPSSRRNVRARERANSSSRTYASTAGRSTSDTRICPSSSLVFHMSTDRASTAVESSPTARSRRQSDLVRLRFTAQINARPGLPSSDERSGEQLPLKRNPVKLASKGRPWNYT